MNQLELYKERLAFVEELSPEWAKGEKLLSFQHKGALVYIKGTDLGNAIDRALVVVMNNTYHTILEDTGFQIQLKLDDHKPIPVPLNYEDAIKFITTEVHQSAAMTMKLSAYYKDGTPICQSYEADDSVDGYIRRQAINEWVIDALLFGRKLEAQMLELEFDAAVAYEISSADGQFQDVWPANKARSLRETLAKTGYTVVPLVRLE